MGGGSTKPEVLFCMVRWVVYSRDTGGQAFLPPFTQWEARNSCFARGAAICFSLPRCSWEGGAR